MPRYRIRRFSKQPEPGAWESCGEAEGQDRKTAIESINPEPGLHYFAKEIGSGEEFGDAPYYSVGPDGELLESDFPGPTSDLNG